METIPETMNKKMQNRMKKERSTPNMDANINLKNCFMSVDFKSERIPEYLCNITQ